MAQVFVSYSRKDLPFVEKLVADLKNAGQVVWCDIFSIGGGARWRIEIENAIRNSQYVIVVLSPDSIASEWVEREFLFASNLKRKIIPLMYCACDLPLYFLNLNYIDMRGENYRNGFPVLLRALSDTETSALPTEVAAHVSENHNKETTGMSKSDTPDMPLSEVDILGDLDGVEIEEVAGRDINVRQDEGGSQKTEHTKVVINGNLKNVKLNRVAGRDIITSFPESKLAEPNSTQSEGNQNDRPI